MLRISCREGVVTRGSCHQRDGWDFSLPKPRDAGFALVTWSLRCDLESLFSSCTSGRLRSVANVIPSSSYMSCRLRSPESCLALTRLLRGSSRPSRNARTVALVWLSWSRRGAKRKNVFQVETFFPTRLASASRSSLHRFWDLQMVA